MALRGEQRTELLDLTVETAVADDDFSASWRHDYLLWLDDLWEFELEEEHGLDRDWIAPASEERKISHAVARLRENAHLGAGVLEALPDEDLIPVHARTREAAGRVARASTALADALGAVGGAADDWFRAYGLVELLGLPPREEDRVSALSRVGRSAWLTDFEARLRAMAGVAGRVESAPSLEDGRKGSPGSWFRVEMLIRGHAVTTAWYWWNKMDDAPEVFDGVEATGVRDAAVLTKVLERALSGEWREELINAARMDPRFVKLSTNRLLESADGAERLAVDLRDVATYVVSQAEQATRLLDLLPNFDAEQASRDLRQVFRR